MGEHEIVKTVRYLTIEMRCPACERGRMIYTRTIIGTDDSNFPDGSAYHHVCSFRGYQNLYPRVYPSETKLTESQEILHTL